MASGLHMYTQIPTHIHPHTENNCVKHSNTFKRFRLSRQDMLSIILIREQLQNPGRKKNTKKKAQKKKLAQYTILRRNFASNIE